MLLSRLGVIYDRIDNLNPNFKTLIIIVLSLIMVEVGFHGLSKLILEDYTELVKHDKYLAEEYTKIITPSINEYIEKILVQDIDASNVLLLNYHNTLTSTHGLSYRYCTSLIEKKRGLQTKSCIRMWKELEYINYGDEIEKINNNKSLRINDLNKYQSIIPNLTELLKLSNAKSAAFYPLIGVEGPVGMLVIIYPCKKDYYLEYYQQIISPSIQPLTIWLDYNSVKEKFEELYESGQAKPERLLQ